MTFWDFAALHPFIALAGAAFAMLFIDSVVGAVFELLACRRR